MPWRGEAYVGEVPTLGYEIASWVQAYCVVPDRENRGDPFRLTDQQLRFVCYMYALTPEGRWLYQRGAQLVRPQKSGKGPLAAALVAAEAAGPVKFAGWDAAGEPVGKPWATPHIQITACSEEQTANTWRALQPMIELGPLRDWIPDSGLTRINLAGGGIIEPVTASARSRLGQRTTFVVQDQTESWVQSNNGWWLADNQRRNLAGMSGRFLETCNAPDPVEQSVAQRTPTEPGVFIDDVDGGPGSVRNKAERRRVLRKVYGDVTTDKGGWVDLDRIDAEIEALIEHDPAQAERFFMNRKLAAEGAAFDPEVFARLWKPGHRVPRGAVIAIGVDGARHMDALAIVATEVATGYQWPLIIVERPPHAPEDYEHDLEAVDGAVTQAMEDYLVWRLYADDQYISPLIERWQNRFGMRRVAIWHTNRPRPIAWAVRAYEEAVAAGDLSHDGNPVFLTHIRNARRRKLTVLDDKERQMHTLSKAHITSMAKIDAAMAAVLSWEARSDCVAAGAVDMGPAAAPAAAPRPPDRYEPDHAPAALALAATGTPNAGPMPD
jgi:hypothetical protein